MRSKENQKKTKNKQRNPKRIFMVFSFFIYASGLCISGIRAEESLENCQMTPKEQLFSKYTGILSVVHLHIHSSSSLRTALFRFQKTIQREIYWLAFRIKSLLKYITVTVISSLNKRETSAGNDSICDNFECSMP